MKKLLTIITCGVIACMLAAVASIPEGAHPWMHITTNNRQFHMVKAEEIDSIIHIAALPEEEAPAEEEPIPAIPLGDDEEEEGNGGKDNESSASDYEEEEQQTPGRQFELGTDSLCLAMKDGSFRVFDLNTVTTCSIGTALPTIYIDLVEHPDWEDLKKKEDYHLATISIDGSGLEPDLAPTEVNIKGRGNTSWWKPKKPYRLKFNKKQNILGMKKAKSFALIADYIDETMLCNAVALKLAQLLEMPFSNTWHPVRVVFNGRPKGAYFITEKIGINSGSVDIDENSGVLFEIDTYYDEKYRFKDASFDLPVMIKDPDLDELAEEGILTADEMLATWQEAFNRVTEAVKKGEDISEVIDLDQVVDYVLVNLVTQNLELQWPKSCFAYMTSPEDKLHFGPVWDFDWAFGYSYKGDRQWNLSMFYDVVYREHPGNDFWQIVVDRPEFSERMQARWEHFYENLYPQLLDYVEETGAQIAAIAKENGTIWPTTGTESELSTYDIETHVGRMKEWLIDHVEWCNQDPRLGLK